MSLVENLVSQISTNGLGGVTKPQGFDLNDDTFEQILKGINKGMNGTELNDQLNTIGRMGQPAGMVIEPFDGTSAVKPIGQENYVSQEPIEIKEVDTGRDYFSNLLKQAPQEHKILMNVAQKYASNIYNNIGKTLVEDLMDFAKDIKSAV